MAFHAVPSRIEMPSSAVIPCPYGPVTDRLYLRVLAHSWHNGGLVVRRLVAPECRHAAQSLPLRRSGRCRRRCGSCQNVEKPSTLIVIPCPVASYMNVVPWLVGVMIQPMAW
jgi:hypothetical protein